MSAPVLQHFFQESISKCRLWNTQQSLTHDCCSSSQGDMVQWVFVTTIFFHKVSQVPPNRNLPRPQMGPVFTAPLLPALLFVAPFSEWSHARGWARGTSAPFTSSRGAHCAARGWSAAKATVCEPHSRAPQTGTKGLVTLVRTTSRHEKPHFLFWLDGTIERFWRRADSFFIQPWREIVWIPPKEFAIALTYRKISLPHPTTCCH